MTLEHAAPAAAAVAAPSTSTARVGALPTNGVNSLLVGLTGFTSIEAGAGLLLVAGRLRRRQPPRWETR